MLPGMKMLVASVQVTNTKLSTALRRLALNALNLEQSYKRTNRQKFHRAAMDNNYMLTVLAGCLFPHDDASRPCCQ